MLGMIGLGVSEIFLLLVSLLVILGVVTGLPQIRAVHVFHDKITEVLRLSKIVNADDVWMIESSQQSPLSLESFCK